MTNFLLLSMLATLPASMNGQACKVTFEDHFKPLDVSAHGPGTRWTAHTPWNGDFGDAAFQDPGPNGAFSTKDGVLAITATKGPDTRWRSGLLSSVTSDYRGFSQQYGYFEIRAKLPPGPGVWPSFWLDEIGERKNVVEFDIFEYYGMNPSRFSSTLHVWKDSTGVGARQDERWTYVPAGSLSTSFHTYAANITPKTIDVYFDGRQVQSFPTPPEYNRPMSLLVDLALGAGWPIGRTISPSVMQVDYVRVCTPTPSAP